MATVLDELVVSLKYQVTGAKQAEATANRVAKATTSVGTAAAKVGAQLSTASGKWAAAFGRWGSSFARSNKQVRSEVASTETGLTKMQGAWSALLAIGAVAWARGQAQELMDVGSQLNKISNELGISTRAVQEFNYAAIDADISIEDMQTGMRGLSRNVLSASRGSKEAALNFSGIGVSVKDLSQLDAAGQFEMMADAISNIQDPGMRTAAAMRVFGRSGATLLPLLNQGSEGIKQLRMEFDHLGGGLTDESIEALGQMEKNIKMMNASMLSFKASLVTLFVPAFTRVQKMFSGFEHQLMEANKAAGILQAVGIGGLILALMKMFKILQSMSTGSWIKDVLGLSKWLLLGAALAAIVVIIQDIYNGLTGGRSAIFEWIDSWAGLGTVDGWIRNIKAGMEEINHLGTGGALGQAFGDLREMWGQTGADEGRADGLKESIEKLKNDPASMGIDISTEAGRKAQQYMLGPDLRPRHTAAHDWPRANRGGSGHGSAHGCASRLGPELNPEPQDY
jgi:hypothetical protein